ncbi:putative ribonuclease H-like domain-containing protein, partial [Tanacetum coccineum]
MDKCKTGLGYNDVLPPYTGNFMPPKPDLVYLSLDDFINVNETVSESEVEKPTVETNEPKTARKENRASIIKDWVSESEEEDEPKFQTGNPQQDLKDKRVIDSRCYMHMTRNRFYLTDYEEIDGGFVAFGGNSKGGEITRKGKIRTGKLDFEDVYFVKELKFNLFSVSQMCDKKNSVLFTDTACVVLSLDFKLTDESHVLLKVPRKDNMTEFKNRVMNQLCEMKGIKREFSVARTPQQNEVAERKNRTLIEAARTMIADLKLPTTFWAEAFNIAYYVQIGYHLGKFDGKVDEGFFVGYSTNSKAFKVFNSKTRIIEENLHVKFSEDTPNIAGKGPNWIFDIDALTMSMNYKPIVIGNQSNGSIGTKACDNVGKAKVETVHGKDYILLPLWTQDPSFSSSSKDSPDAGFKPSGEEEKKDAEDPGNKDIVGPSIEEPRVNQEKDASVNNTNIINTVSSPVNTAGIENNVVDENIVYGCANDLNMHELEEISIFSDAENDNSGANMNNLDTYFQVSPIPTIRIHKDHPLEQVTRDLHSAPQTRRMTMSLEEHGLRTQKGSSSTKGSKLDRSYAGRVSTIQVTRIWTLVELPNGKRAIRTKWIFMNKKDERGIAIKNKARLVAQGYTQEEWIDYDEFFTPIARIEAIRLFLAYVSFKDFVVYQMDVNSDFLYGKIEMEVYVCQPPGFEDPDFPDRVYKVENALYGLHQAPRAWYETLSTYLLDNGFQRGKIDQTLFIKRDKSDILLVQVYVDDIIFGSTRKKMCTEFEKMMHKKFQMSSMGELIFFLGLQVKQKEDGIFISQD